MSDSTKALWKRSNPGVVGQTRGNKTTGDNKANSGARGKKLPVTKSLNSKQSR